MTTSRATDEAVIDAFKWYASAADWYVTELDLIAYHGSRQEPGTTEMLRVLAERDFRLALDLVRLWLSERGADHRR